MWTVLGRTLSSKEPVVMSMWHTRWMKIQMADFAKAAAQKTKGKSAKPAKGSKGKWSPDAAYDMGSQTDSKLQMMLKALEPHPVKPLDMTEEELEQAAQRAKEYSRKRMHEHRQWQIDLTTKLRLKKEAIQALPDDLRAAAMVPDYELFPTNRLMWTETPPREEGATKKRVTDGAKSKKPSFGTKKR